MRRILLVTDRGKSEW